MKIDRLRNKLKDIEEEHGTVDVKPLEGVEENGLEVEMVESDSGLAWFKG